MAEKKRQLRRRFKMLPTGIGSVIVLLVIGISIFYFWASSSSLPENKLSEIINHPDPTPPPPASNTFTIMTMNIGYLSGMTNNLPMETKKELFDTNMNTFLQLLDKIKPDVLAVQEIDFDSKRSFYVNQFQTIAGNTNLKYTALAVNWDKKYVPFPYWPPSVHFGKVVSGQGVLSQWPMASTERVVLLKPMDKPFYYNALYLDRLVQIVKIKIGDVILVVLNVHLEAFDHETREKQAQRVLNIYRGYKDNFPVILLGDFNCIPPDAGQKKSFIDEPDIDFTGDKTIHLFLAEKSLKPAELDTVTFPSDKPTRKLDYIFYNFEKIVLLKTFAPEIDSSDHLPLVMEFSLIPMGHGE